MTTETEEAVEKVVKHISNKEDKRKVVFFGVPGSGKTTTLLKIITKLVEEGKMKTEDMCFTTYTKEGIRNIFDKMKEKQVNGKKKWFKTMNSLTWKLAGYEDRNIMKDELKIEFFKSNNIRYNPAETTNKKEWSEGNFYLDFYKELVTTKKTHAEDIDKIETLRMAKSYILNNREANIHYETLLRAHYKFLEWKKSNNLYTYEDSLVDVYTNRIPLESNIELLIIDEAQDLDQLQIDIIEMWQELNPELKITLAGDDDQSLYIWKGAVPNYLISLTKTEFVVVLEKSFRVPEEIAKFANLISSDIEVRQEKEIIPLKKGGSIKYSKNFTINDLKKIIKEGEKTFILFRTNYLRDEYSKLIREQTNFTFNFLGKGKKIPNKIIKISNALNKIDTGKKVMIDEFIELIDAIKSKKVIKRGKKYSNVRKKEERIEKILKTEGYPSSGADKSFILTHFFEMGVEMKYNNDKYDFKDYLIRNLNPKTISEENKKLIKKNKKIIRYNYETKSFEFDLEIGTYHSSKSLEAENVIVILNSLKNPMSIDDNEKRLLYTAVTRSKNKLFLCETNDLNGSDGEIIRYTRKIYRKYLNLSTEE